MNRIQKTFFRSPKNIFQSLVVRNGTLSKQPYNAFSTLLIKNGLIVNADAKFKGDVLINDHKITQILKPGQEVHATTVIDAKGKYIIPGGIDPHVHMELQFMGTVTVDDFNIGSRASVAGGTTSFIDFIFPDEKGLIAGYDDWRSRADPKVHANYTLHCAITHWNKQVSEEMGEMVKRGVTSFKLFMAYRGTSLYHSDDEIIQILLRCKELGAICLVHAENSDLIQFNQERLNKKGVFGPEGHLWSRGDEIEAEAVHRVITIAKEINTPLYVVHIMKPSAAEVVRDAKKKGYVVFAEALASGLGVDGRQCSHHDQDHAASYVMSPALDDNPMTKELLFRLLATHDLDTTATDNCVFTKAQKRAGKDNFTKIPNGINGIEDRMSVVWTQGVGTGVLSPSDFVRVTSTNAAKIFNMYPRKGVIQVGSDADIVVWDPEASKVISAKTHHHAGDFNIFEGIKVKGLTETTIVNGKVVFQDGKVLSQQGSGKFIGRKNFGFAYERIFKIEEARDLKETPIDRSGKAGQSLEEKYSTLKNEYEVSQIQLKQQAQKIQELKDQLPKNTCTNIWDTKFKNEITSVENVLQKYLPDKEYEAIRQIREGSKAQELKLPQKAYDLANQYNFDIKGYSIPSHKEELRQPRVVRVGAVQNSIKESTSAPVKQQQKAMLDWITHVVEAAHIAGVNVLGVQECWNMPFFMCTREKYPWIEFAEDYENGPSAVLFKELAQKYNMVIVNHILERDAVKGTIHNTSVLINNYGKIQGRSHKNHIPRVGDFNESTYYMEGEQGHPVFETDFGRIGINICYGRHHPLNWLMLGLNGAEIVFNPSATIGNLSEPMWDIEARCAAIANHYFTVSINRVGTEYYKHAFTSGDGKPPKHEFGMFYGSSYISAPDASRTPGLSRTRDGLLVTELDLNLCRQIADKWGFHMTSRLPMYSKLLSQAAQENYKQQIVK